VPIWSAAALALAVVAAGRRDPSLILSVDTNVTKTARD
jgi:hypothetical protein